MKYYPLKVEQIKEETAGVKTLFLEIPADLLEFFNFTSGQYVTIEHSFDEQSQHQGCYISSAPHEDRFSITIKNNEQSGLTHFLTKEVQEGDIINVSAPQGRFGKKMDPDQRISYFMIGAGIGIIPLFSLIKNILEEQPLSTVYLLYGNRTYDDILFRDALFALSELYLDQFYLRFVLSQHGTRALINLERNPGRINKSSLHRFLEDYSSPISAQKFFICGPGSMIDDLEAELLHSGVARELIHSERFHPETGKVNEFELRKTDMAMSSKAKITLDGNYIELEIHDQTILQTLIDAGYDPPFSCTSGVCTTCMAKLTRGAVEMEVNYGLHEDDVKKGFILTCQSHPTTEAIEVNYDF